MAFRHASRLISYLTAFCGLSLLIRSPSGMLGAVMWLPKLWAGAWAPFLAALGALGTLLGLVSRDRNAVRAGLFGTITALRYVIRVTSRHDRFAQAFGPDWVMRIPSDLRARMPRRRYMLVQPESPVVPGQRNIQLGVTAETGQPLLCDIWEPAPGRPHTGLAVIYLHGSLWQALDKDFLTQPLFRRLAGQGHVIADMAYPLAPAADLRCMIKSVKQAILWLKERASEYGVDPARIALMGASGGGHLALLAAYTPNLPAFQPEGATADTSVRAAVSLYGVTDLAAFFQEYGRVNPKQPEFSSQITEDLSPRVFDTTSIDKILTRYRVFPPFRYGNMPGGSLLLINMLGGTLREAPEAYRLGSPIAHVGPHCPPTLQLFGDDDFVVNASHGRRLHRALRQAEALSVYIEYPDTVHGFDQYFGVSRRVSPAAQAATYDIERFLALMV